ncbi:hypothetical protein CPB86DRAFT_878441 [Serendipita vermifera]|nr:hypothetical protein CPB86DRAFT_878441 [Serendipita vermifera]
MSSKTKYKRIKKRTVDEPKIAQLHAVEVEMVDAPTVEGSIAISMSAFESITNTLQSLTQRIDQLQLDVDSVRFNSGQKLLPGILLDRHTYDGALDTASNCSRQSPETKLVRNIMRRYARERLGIEGLGDTADWPTPNDDVVAEYNASAPGSIGPTEGKLIIDWGTTGRTPWTKTCAEIFARDFCSQHEIGAFPLPQGYNVEASEIKQFFLIYVTGLKRKYKRT